jgi:hypothetical protein
LEGYFGKEERIGNGHSLIASENGILYGLLYSRPMKMNGGIVVEPVEQVFSSKFYVICCIEEISGMDAKQGMSVAIALLTTFLPWLHDHVAQKLPMGGNETFYIDVLSVHPDCRG